VQNLYEACGSPLLQDNSIEHVDLQGMPSLFMVNLSHNKLATIHGLNGCNNLRWLDLSHNKLTKLGK
jgi:Leucine-rich repeat (LRR) protein